MSDSSQGPGWWLASDGKWYRPSETEEPPEPGWWLASDGKWYRPSETEEPPEPGWWLASDGKWYPPSDDSEPDAGEPETGEATEQPAMASAVSSDLATRVAPTRASKVVADQQSGDVADAPPADAEAQIRRRNDASRQDAINQAPARWLAASRAVKILEDEIAAESETLIPETTREPAAEESKPPPPVVAKTATPKTATIDDQAPVATAVGATKVLIELRSSPLGADLDHIGDRLVIFGDRVELRDRNDQLRQTIMGSEISDVVVQRKVTGAALSIERGEGPPVVMKGLKLELAEQAKTIIMSRTRKGRPNPPAASAPAPAPAASTSASSPKLPPQASVSAPPAEQIELLAKLQDLHRAGVLSDSEFETKAAALKNLAADEAPNRSATDRQP